MIKEVPKVTPTSSTLARNHRLLDVLDYTVKLEKRVHKLEMRLNELSIRIKDGDTASNIR